MNVKIDKILAWNKHKLYMISTFTTRPDTIFGVTFLVLAPEHPLVDKLTTKEQAAEVQKYVAKAKAKSDMERQVSKEKTGVFTGAFTRHPFTKKKIPVWIADYVLYG